MSNFTRKALTGTYVNAALQLLGSTSACPHTITAHLERGEDQ